MSCKAIVLSVVLTSSLWSPTVRADASVTEAVTVVVGCLILGYVTYKTWQYACGSTAQMPAPAQAPVRAENEQDIIASIEYYAQLCAEEMQIPDAELFVKQVVAVCKELARSGTMPCESELRERVNKMLGEHKPSEAENSPAPVAEEATASEQVAPSDAFGDRVKAFWQHMAEHPGLQSWAGQVSLDGLHDVLWDDTQAGFM